MSDHDELPSLPPRAAGAGSTEDFATSNAPRCRDGSPACVDCLMRGACDEAPVDLFDCDIKPRELAYPLRDYHFAPGNGPLHATWQDKPHRLLYDLIAAVRFYAARAAGQEIPADGYVTITTDQAGECVAVTRNDEEGRILRVLWKRPADSTRSAPRGPQPTERVEGLLQGDWVITGPDGSKFHAATSLRAALQANRHRVQTDPVAVKQFQDAIERGRREAEEENARLIAEHGTLNCPACGGSGHIGDAIVQKGNA